MRARKRDHREVLTAEYKLQLLQQRPTSAGDEVLHHFIAIVPSAAALTRTRGDGLSGGR